MNGEIEKCSKKGKLHSEGARTLAQVDDSGKKHIDDLVVRRERSEAELKEIGNQIRTSARTAAVVFIDLKDSTALKESTDAEIGLASIYCFLQTLDQKVRHFGGTLVDRI